MVQVPDPWFAALRVAVKTWLSRHTLVIEFCKDCGRKQPLVWTANDPLWIALWGNAGGVLCPECFDRRAVAVGIALRWVPQVES